MIIIRIKTDNAAFQDDEADRGNEVGRILHELADAYISQDIPVTLRDINGNAVGTVRDSG